MTHFIRVTISSLLHHHIYITISKLPISPYQYHHCYVTISISSYQSISSPYHHCSTSPYQECPYLLSTKVATRMADSMWDLKIGGVNHHISLSLYFSVSSFFFCSLSLYVSPLSLYALFLSHSLSASTALYQSCHKNGRFYLGSQDRRSQIPFVTRSLVTLHLFPNGYMYIYICTPGPSCTSSK